MQRHRLKVICAPIPLTSLTDGVAAVKRTIGRTNGPVVVAGHAYADAVIAAADDEAAEATLFHSRELAGKR